MDISFRGLGLCSLNTEMTLLTTDLELVMQSFNVVLDPLYQLSLVLTDGSSDVWAHKQCIES